MTQKGNVYIIYAPDTRFYKIGESNNPDRRIGEFETCLPNGVEIYGIYPFLNKDIAQRKEEHLHDRFNGKRINPKREWFKLDPVDLMEANKFLNGGGRISKLQRWRAKLFYFIAKIKSSRLFRKT